MHHPRSDPRVLYQYSHPTTVWLMAFHCARAVMYFYVCLVSIGRIALHSPTLASGFEPGPTQTSGPLLAQESELRSLTVFPVETAGQTRFALSLFAVCSLVDLSFKDVSKHKVGDARIATEN